MIYEVHDEDGKLRVFYNRKQAEHFAQPWHKIVAIKEARYRKPAPDLSAIPPALF